MTTPDPAAAAPDPSADPTPDPAADPTPDPEPVRDPAAVLAHNDELLAEVKTTREKLAQFEADAEERRKAQLSEQEKAIEEATLAGRAEAETEFGQLLLRERIITRATGEFADPTDAVALLDLTDIDPNDPKAIDGALIELAKAKPHLLAKPKRRGPIDQGPQGDTIIPGDADGWLRGVLRR